MGGIETIGRDQEHHIPSMYYLNYYFQMRTCILDWPMDNANNITWQGVM